MFFDKIFFEFFDKKDLKKAALIHCSILLSLGLSSFSSYLDDKKAVKIKKLKNLDKYIQTTMISKIDYEKLKASKSQPSKEEIVPKTPIPEEKIEVPTEPIIEEIETKKPEVVSYIQSEILRRIPKKENLQKEILKEEIVPNSPIPEEKIEVPIEPIIQKNIEIDNIIKQMNEYSSIASNKTIDFSENTKNPLSIIEYQIENCWSKYSAGQNFNNIIISISVEYQIDGKIKSIYNLKSNNEHNSISKKMQEDVISALNDCNPLRGLDPSTFNQWQTMNYFFKYSKEN